MPSIVVIKFHNENTPQIIIIQTFSTQVIYNNFKNIKRLIKSLDGGDLVIK